MAAIDRRVNLPPGRPGEPAGADATRTTAPGRAAARSARAFSRILRALAGFAGGLLAGPHSRAVDLPADTSEAMYHVYDGGGVKSTGPAVLLRKTLADKVSLSGSYYVDAVSNASIDVVTTASPYKERRTELGVAADYAVRDTLMTVGLSSSTEPDYKARSLSVDVSQEVFGNMSTVSLGFTRGADDVGRHGEGFFDTARHWKYRLGLSQVLTPRWVASAQLELVADTGFLGSPYRVARVFGAAVPERMPRTRTSRALQLGATGDIGGGTALRAEYRYFWDTWAVKAHTVEFGGSHHFGDKWLGDAWVRWYRQGDALFYSDNAAVETTYITRNRQLSRFSDTALGVQASYTWKQVPGRYEIKLNGSAELLRFNFNDFTDLRTGGLYSHSATLLQLFVSGTF